jgi:hypothetical protein
MSNAIRQPRRRCITKRATAETQQAQEDKDLCNDRRKWTSMQKQCTRQQRNQKNDKNVAKTFLS